MNDTTFTAEEVSVLKILFERLDYDEFLYFCLTDEKRKVYNDMRAKIGMEAME